MKDNEAKTSKTAILGLMAGVLGSLVFFAMKGC